MKKLNATAIFAKLMFNDDDNVCCGSLFDNKVGKFLDGSGSSFYTINPIDDKIDHASDEKEKYDYTTPRRADINVSRFSNFIFEQDTINLEDQMRILKGCGIPWTAIVYSGSKSYHALLALDSSLGGQHTQEGISQYKSIWKRLSLKIEAYANTLGFTDVVDQSGKNPSRFTRYVGTIRENGNEQAIKYLGSRISLQDFNDLLKTCPKIFVPVKTNHGSLDVNSVEEFLESAPKALANEFKYPINLSPNGQYAKVFRLSMWCRDLGVSEDLCEQLFNYRIFPGLINVGYAENRLNLGIIHAYRK